MIPLLLLAAQLAEPAAAAQGPAEIVATAPASAWRPIAAEDLLLVETARGLMTIQLAPVFAPAHVSAIRASVRAGEWSGGAVVRVQDNYVVQFAARESLVSGEKPPAEYDRPAAGLHFRPLGYADAYAEAGHVEGWPAARDKTGTAWLVHCYGMVGVGRGQPPDTGDGRELYAVIGHAPRHLDRNLAVVGRVLEGLPPLAALPRGSEALGFYKTDAERLPITQVRVASDLPRSEQPRFEVMDTVSASFSAFVEARANRREPFFQRPAGGVDLCNAPVPARRAN